MADGWESRNLTGRRGAEPLVAVEHLGKRYGPYVAIENVSLALHAGEILGVVGANGSGKTTMLRLLAGILRADQGYGEVLGFDLRDGAAQIRSRVGYLSQRLSLYAELSVFENLHFRAELYRAPDAKAVAEAAVSAFDLSRYRGSRAGALSGGWARRLQLAVTLIHSPRLILLDEPTVGLDAGSRHDVWHRIAALASAGAGVIVSTHDLAEAERLSRIALFFDGRIISSGSPDRVAQVPQAVAFRLSGLRASRLAQAAGAITGIIACSSEGEGVRLVADPLAEGDLRRFAAAHQACRLDGSATQHYDDICIVASGNAPYRPYSSYCKSGSVKACPRPDDDLADRGCSGHPDWVVRLRGKPRTEKRPNRDRWRHGGIGEAGKPDRARDRILLDRRRGTALRRGRAIGRFRQGADGNRAAAGA